MRSWHLLLAIKRNLLLTPLILHLLKALVLWELAWSRRRTLHILRKLSRLVGGIKIERSLEVDFLIYSTSIDKHSWCTDCRMVSRCWSMTWWCCLAESTTRHLVIVTSSHIFIGNFWLPMFLLPCRLGLVRFCRILIEVSTVLGSCFTASRSSLYH